MKTIRRTWLPLLLLFAAQPAAALTPEQDIVAVVSAQPLSGIETVPGLLTGQRVMDRLRVSLEFVRGGVPDAARAGLDRLGRELRRLSVGDGPESPLPASYRNDGELWLPVRAQRLRVRLDAPDLRPRPGPRRADGQPGNLPARATRIDWLPVGLTAQRVARALPLLSAGKSGRARAQRLLEGALHGVQSTRKLEHRPLILAYYRAEAALAAVPTWDDVVRARLRRSAESLNSEPGAADLAARLLALADRPTPDQHELQELALSLRKRIILSAASPSDQNPADHKP